MKTEPANLKPERIIIDLKGKGFRNAFVIGKYTYSGAREKLKTHSHPGMIEICYCDKGEQIYEVGDRVYKIVGGDVFVTFPNEPHGTADQPEDKGILYWVQLIIPAIKKEFLGYSGKNAEILINALLNMPSRHFKATAEVKKLLENIIRLGQSPNRDLHKLMIYNHLTSFLLQVIKCSENTRNKTGMNKRMEHVKKYIHNNVGNELSIAMLADLENISESHFKSLFKREFGITPMDYVLRTKIEEAKKILLQNQDTRITEVAYQLGFCSSQYFSTVFKKYTGKTPQNYRTLS